MAQTMRMDLAKPGPSGSGGDDLGHPAGTEGTMRCLDAYEHRPA
jgi:hypothetical protein